MGASADGDHGLSAGFGRQGNGGAGARWRTAVLSARHDLGPVSGAGREDAVVANQIEPWCNYGGIGGPKAALEAMGRAGGPVRPPGPQVAQEDRPMIVDILRAHPETQTQVLT